jgi:hypothetical protein
MTRTKTIEVTLYGITGFGSTRAEAKAAAEARITAALDGHDIPTMLRFPMAIVGLVYRDLWGWQYSIMTDQMQRGYVVHTNAQTAQEAERMLRRHVAQNLLFQVEDHGLSVMQDAQDRADHVRYVDWQECYRAAAKKGYDDADARRIADGYAALEELPAAVMAPGISTAPAGGVRGWITRSTQDDPTEPHGAAGQHRLQREERDAGQCSPGRRAKRFPWLHRRSGLP